MGLRPDHCQLCEKKEVDWGVPNGVHLKYCRLCRRYACTEQCFDIDYCLVCESNQRRKKQAKGDEDRERLGLPPLIR